MKKILLIFAMLFSIMSFGQNQNFTGVKTFTSPPKFKNLTQNELNTKIMSINSSTDRLEWIDKSTISGAIPTLQQVLMAGNYTFDNISIIDAYKTATYGSNGLYVLGTSNSAVYGSIFMGIQNISETLKAGMNLTDGLYLKTNQNGFVSYLKSDFLTADRYFQFPDATGYLPALNTTAPTSSADVGNIGEIRVTDTFIYVCTATNTWVRSGASTW